ncbi:peptide-methionine (S)-S-oxide reductase MsrA [Hoeflea marina]|nr:peptide-methionine (S)-S-oxide reductase MsrA [Hoeflea marina]
MLLIGAVAAVSMAAGPARSAETGTAIFAGGCFWCVESDFDKVKGVTSTVSGYIGGTTDNPTYENHVAGGHREAVEISYDPSVVSYAELLKTFFRTVDPTDAGGQFCDRGPSYTTAVYTLDAAQADEAATAAADAAAQLGTKIATEIIPAPEFWPAEDYHQDYHDKNPIRYTYYRRACGRDGVVGRLWGEQADYGLTK